MNEKKYTISAVIPTYNRREELLRAVRSVWAQTLQPLELIIVDDCSDFDVEKLLEEEGILSETATHFIRNNQNSGPAFTRNAGVSKAKGDLIAFLDSDDYWAEDKLEKQFALFEADDQLGFVYCDTWIVEEGKKRPRGMRLIHDGIFRAAILENWTAPNTSTLMLKRALFHSLNGFDNNLQSNQDFDLWFKMARADTKVSFVAEPLSYFSYDADNRVTTNFRRKFGGGLKFLRKWKPVIISDLGKRAYRIFKSRFMFGLAFPIFLDRLKRRKLWEGGQIFFKYLIFSQPFYQTLSRKIGGLM